MRIPSIITRKKKLRASTARRSRNLGLPDEMDYEQMSEPNMKLSRALLIVLVLHIVAVAGIVAFNTIKTRENFAPATPDTIAPATPSAAPAAPEAVESALSAERGDVLKTARATTDAPTAPNESVKVAAASEEKAATPAPKSTVKDSGKIYTVVRGDNPVTIARHLKVSEGDLLELNQITDPRRLQINQKLHIPERRPSSKSK
ncbi:MAG TPA: LysM domain-containing protein [Chthoniobacterales bacterium]|jgi:LysM repeat protein